MTRSRRSFLFLAFFLSGGCALVYQIVWTRLAFASFGIIAPVLSVVISVFMLGLCGGAWAGGRWVGPLVRKTGGSALLFYGLAELLVGIGGISVPKLFGLGELLLLSGQTDSFRYLFLSALVLGLSILPWCLFMGATLPFMMAYVREQDPTNSDSFSYLYLANVLGAMAGCLLTALFLVEVLGFKRTVWTAAFVNFIVAAISGYFALKQGRASAQPASKVKSSARTLKRSFLSRARLRALKGILFATGFSAMAMEVIWARAFTPVLTTQVYSFALILFAYLGSTFFGSLLYRHHLRKGSVRSVASLISMLSVATFLPIVCNDTRFLAEMSTVSRLLSVAVLLLSICPLCALLGYLTPSLIDEYLSRRSRRRRAGLCHKCGRLYPGTTLCFVSRVAMGRRAHRAHPPWHSVSCL